MKYTHLFFYALLTTSFISAMHPHYPKQDENVQTLAHRAWCQANIHSYCPQPRPDLQHIMLSDLTLLDCYDLTREHTLKVPEQKTINCIVPETQKALHCTQEQYEQKEKELACFLKQLHDSQDLFANSLNIYLKFLTFDTPVLPLLFRELEKEDQRMCELRKKLHAEEFKLEKLLLPQSRELTINMIKLHACDLEVSLKRIMAIEMAVRLCQIHENCGSAYASIAKMRLQPFEKWALQKINHEKQK